MTFDDAAHKPGAGLVEKQGERHDEAFPKTATEAILRDNVGGKGEGARQGADGVVWALVGTICELVLLGQTTDLGVALGYIHHGTAIAEGMLADVLVYDGGERFAVGVGLGT